MQRKGRPEAATVEPDSAEQQAGQEEVGERERVCRGCIEEMGAREAEAAQREGAPGSVAPEGKVEREPAKQQLLPGGIDHNDRSDDPNRKREAPAEDGGHRDEHADAGTPQDSEGHGRQRERHSEGRIDHAVECEACEEAGRGVSEQRLQRAGEQQGPETQQVERRGLKKLNPSGTWGTGRHGSGVPGGGGCRGLVSNLDFRDLDADPAGAAQHGAAVGRAGDEAMLGETVMHRYALTLRGRALSEHAPNGQVLPALRKQAHATPQCYPTALVTNAPHDALFKTIFGHPEHAAAELRHILPGHVAARIDWATLTPQPGSYVDEELADQHSDLLFSAAIQPTAEPVFVYVLFEHQSTAQHTMALRSLRYMVRIWTRHANDHPALPLPLIIPAVLTHVPGGWTAPTRFAHLFSASVGDIAPGVLPDFQGLSTTSTTATTMICAPARSPTPRAFPCGCSVMLATETHSCGAFHPGRRTSNPSPKRRAARSCSSCFCATSPGLLVTCTSPRSVPSLTGRRPQPRPSP